MFKIDVVCNIHIHMPHDDKPPSWARRILHEIADFRGAMESSMAKLEDRIAEMEALQVTMGESIVGVAGDTAASTAIIADLRSQLAGNLTPEQDALFDRVLGKQRDQAAKLAEIDAANPSTGDGAGSPSPEMPPVEEPAPGNDGSGGDAGAGGQSS